MKLKFEGDDGDSLAQRQYAVSRMTDAEFDKVCRLMPAEAIKYAANRFAAWKAAQECPSCLGHGQLSDADTGRLRKCLDCFGTGQKSAPTQSPPMKQSKVVAEAASVVLGRSPVEAGTRRLEAALSPVWWVILWNDDRVTVEIQTYPPGGTSKVTGRGGQSGRVLHWFGNEAEAEAKAHAEIAHRAAISKAQP